MTYLPVREKFDVAVLQSFFFVLIMFSTSVSSSSTIIVSRLLHIKMYASAHIEQVHSTGLENERSLQMSPVIFGALNPTKQTS